MTEKVSAVSRSNSSAIVHRQAHSDHIIPRVRWTMEPGPVLLFFQVENPLIFHFHRNHIDVPSVHSSKFHVIMDKLFRPSTIQNFSKLLSVRTASSLQKQNPKNKNFVILRATKDDYNCILKLMERSYYPDEPTCSSLAFKVNAVFEDHALKCMSQGMTLIAKCKYNGDILGVCINDSANPWDPDLTDKLACTVGCVKSRQLLHFYAYMQRIPDLWNRYCVQKIFEMVNLFVRKDQRGKGLALKLMQDSRILAADCGFTLIRVDATSAYTAKLCEKLGMKKVYEIPYCSYVGADQEPIFKPKDPHKSVKIYVDDEPQKNSLNQQYSGLQPPSLPKNKRCY